MSVLPVLTPAEFDELYGQVCTWGRWGSDDQRGALNHITSEAITAACRSVRSGRTVGMSRPVATTAAADNPKPAAHFMTVLPDMDIGSGSLRLACDFLGMEFHGHIHTHVDALCHVAYRGKLYNGFPATEVRADGARVGDIDVLRDGFVTRGVLVDVPRMLGSGWLEPGHGISGEDIERAEQLQGVRLAAGDALFLRTGQALRRRELGPLDPSEGKAGLHPHAVPLLHSRRIAALGCDADADAAPSYVAGIQHPIHALCINGMGLHFFDSLDLEELARACADERRWEFLLVAAPLRLQGGTGSPVNPIAVF